MKWSEKKHSVKDICLYLTLLLISGSLYSCQRSDKVANADFFPVFEIIKGKGNDFEGYLFLRKTDKPGMQLMVDNHGSVVWSLLTDSAVSREFYPLENSFICLSDGRSFFEISYKGDTLVKISDPDFSFPNELHHEIIKLKNGNYAALTKDVLMYDYSRFGYKKTDSLITDGIVEFNASGKALWRWSFTSVIDTLQTNTIDIFQLKNDWVHANSLSEDDDGNFLVSFRDLNEVWKINRTDGSVLFRYGGQGKEGSPGKFKAQHMFYRLNPETYIVFNNGPARDSINSSAAVFFKYLPENNSFVNTRIIRLPDSVFTLKEGSVVPIEPDKFLFSISRTKDILIIDSAGQVQWWAKSNLGFYRAYFVKKSVLKDKGLFDWLPF